MSHRICNNLYLLLNNQNVYFFRKIPPGDGDIVVQLDLINEQDDNSLISRQSSINSCINFDSPAEIFQTILQMVIKKIN